MSKRAALVLEDGRAFHGYAFGADVVGEGEVVFNTCMTGYQEICTDPSYRGQIVALTYPLIGNYGVADKDAESRRPWLAGLAVRDLSLDYSNWRAETDLHAYLIKYGIPGIFGFDTRALTRHLRTKGTLRAVLSPLEDQGDIEQLVRKARRIVPLSEQDLVAQASISQRYAFLGASDSGERPATDPRIAVIDCGIKENILRSMSGRGTEVVVVPHDVHVEDILELSPQGVLVSNGPGDPASLPELAQVVRGLLERRMPLFGICLGHQLLGLAIGATTSRLKFGHHGGNHPVRDVITNRVYITSQNHEFQVDRDSIPRENGYFVSHFNLNDGSVEGLAHATEPVFSVQYHPEGSPGPQDNQYLFDRFCSLVVSRGG
ncbi:MAG: glutamine-hydrolyzing carbamoyl-phosphate synthase small subunit [Chloroflexi bacterium]|nr:glutamine-hydrolyzing carbamoyl-phosphate synthase small subunit [Chloroflexota bacterium]